LDSNTLWLALALALIGEAMFPFISPSNWRSRLAQVMQMSDGQIRFFALACILIGLLLIWWLTG
jgi:uncharacterized protein YjeT (DUF2065 family)